MSAPAGIARAPPPVARGRPRVARGGGEENETHEHAQGSAGVSSLPDAERDACDVVQALASLAALLQGAGGDHPLPDAVRGMVRRLVEDGTASAERVLAYLRAVRGPGDGEAVAVPPGLGTWQDWVPASRNVLGDLGRAGVERRMGQLHPRRSDPGE